MHVERCTRLCQAKMANEIAEGLGRRASGGVGRIKPINRRLDLPPQASFIEGQHAPAAQHEATANHHAIDRRAVFPARDNPSSVAAIRCGAKL